MNGTTKTKGPDQTEITTGPTYYVRHPDGSFSVAAPQPTSDDLRRQAEVTYAQCDQHHGGFVCTDPYCHLNRRMPFGDHA